MPSVNERLDAQENAIIKLAANKLDITDYNARVTIENTRYLDLINGIRDLLARISAIEDWIVNRTIT